jgi:hypothetical protein
MSKDRTDPHKRDATGRLHPAIYRILAAFVGGWLVISLAFFLGGSGGGRAYGGLIAPIIAAFGLITVLVPWDIRRIGRAHPGRHNPDRPSGSLRAWLNKDFLIWDGQVRGRDAAIMVLLPGVAAMIGGTALAIVFHFAR